MIENVQKLTRALIGEGILQTAILRMMVMIVPRLRRFRELIVEFERALAARLVTRRKRM